jgi:nucleotide-binding universal stress UspA family protein
MTQLDLTRDPAVVVGVDGSERNQSAIDWAAGHAAASRRDLLLVGVACMATTPPQPWTESSTVQYDAETTSGIVDRVRRRVLSHGQEVRVLVPVGTPSRELVKAVVAGDVLVVGRRGVGPFERAVLGSTSIEAAGRSPVATVIVPDDWDAAGNRGRALVAGVDGTERDVPVLEFAFDLAATLGVTLVVVSAWEAPPLYAWEQPDLARWTKEAEERLDERIVPWTKRHPDVDVACHAPATEPSAALLEDAHDAQMVVLGRFPGVHHLTGFSGFSTCRRVLHHATCPVAVVPVPTRV